MRGASSEFLGQELMRAAFDAQSLEPFDAPIRKMRGEGPPVERANAYRAAMFGLIGAAFHGWEEEVVVPSSLPTEAPLLSGSYRFVEHIAQPVDFRECFSGWAENPRNSVGGVALASLQRRLESEAGRYLAADRGQQIHGGLDTFDIFERMWSVAEEAEDLGVSDTPVFFSRTFTGYRAERTPLKLTDSYGERMTKDDFRQTVASSAGNFARFTKTPINELMRGFTLPSATGLEIPEGCTEQEVPGIIARLLGDSVRATQRIDGTDTRLLENDMGRRTFLRLNRRGQLVLSWARREQKPPTKLQPPDIVPKSGPSFQPVVDRQKCPVSYNLDTDFTPDGKLIMPGQRIAAATQGYMQDNLLLNPAIYMLKI